MFGKDEYLLVLLISEWLINSIPYKDGESHDRCPCSCGDGSKYETVNEPICAKHDAKVKSDHMY